MKIVSQTHNTLLKRKEVVFSLENVGAPSTVSATETAATHFKVAADTVVVKDIRNSYGDHLFTISAYIYDTKELKEKVEPKKKMKKGASA